ncbi:MAG: TonB-dependent receptor [Gammaproteobacteria bacterium]|nr:MAG: TonB-dependent receptor [Gammaproteobacteria bacterium]
MNCLKFTGHFWSDIMHITKLLPLPLLMLGLNTPLYAEHISLPTISVEGSAGEETPYALLLPAITSPDTGELLKRLPGANINRNGPLTSIAQYRGLFGDRVNVLIDGMRINPAGPNTMDSPLSYIPASRLEEISLYRGIAPVSTGMETIGGTIVANSKKPAFGDGDEMEFHGNANAGYNENGNSYQSSVLAGITNKNHKFHITGSIESGDDLEFPDGEILPSEHERDTFGAGYAFQNGQQSVSLQAEHHDTGETGTPALPMDIIYARGENYSGQFKNKFTNGGELSANLSYQDADHRMANYVLRTPPSPMMRRHAITDVETLGIGMAYNFSSWTVGFDTDQSEHNADIFSPDNTMFYVDNYNDIERDRYGIFGEKIFTVNDWKIETGVRYSRIEMDAGTVDSSMSMMPNMMGANVRTLRNNFNNADREQNENLFDIVLNGSFPLSSQLDIITGLARKERAPSYQERYLWLPLESTGGLADGNNYIGDVSLDPETAYQAELGLDWHTPKAAFSPRVFYHHIDDYIQGTPSTNAAANMLSAMMGNPDPLQFTNVDAKLYGIDANWLVALTNQWQLDGTVSYVRGERRDTSDNLYRIAPLTARTMLSYIKTEWSVGVEAVTVASQDDVSSENSESKTSGYAFFNLLGSYQATQGLTLSAGVNNVFDREYQDHLGGYNRIKDNPDIAQGERLPGLGRSAYVSANFNW